MPLPVIFCVPLDNNDWQMHGHHIPLLVNMQPAGKYLGEDYQQAGGVPAVVGELIAGGLLPHPQALTVNGHTMGANCDGLRSKNSDVIKTTSDPMKAEAGFINLSGNLFESAIMKTSVISPAFRQAYLSNPEDPDAFEGRAIVFDGPEDFHHRIDDPAENIDEGCVLFMRGAGPKGYPGAAVFGSPKSPPAAPGGAAPASGGAGAEAVEVAGADGKVNPPRPGAAEVVNMRPPSYLIKRGVEALPCVGDGRQSGTSGSPSILNASPEAADGGGLALLQTGDKVRIDLGKGTADMLVPLDVLNDRARALAAKGGYDMPASQSPWQEIFREKVGRLDHGMTLDGADKYQNIARRSMPRDNH